MGVSEATGTTYTMIGYNLQASQLIRTVYSRTIVMTMARKTNSSLGSLFWSILIWTWLQTTGVRALGREAYFIRIYCTATPAKLSQWHHCFNQVAVSWVDAL